MLKHLQLLLYFGVIAVGVSAHGADRIGASYGTRFQHACKLADVLADLNRERTQNEALREVSRDAIEGIKATLREGNLHLPEENHVLIDTMVELAPIFETPAFYEAVERSVHKMNPQILKHRLFRGMLLQEFLESVPRASEAEKQALSETIIEAMEELIDDNMSLSNLPNRVKQAESWGMKERQTAEFLPTWSNIKVNRREDLREIIKAYLEQLPKEINKGVQDLDGALAWKRIFLRSRARRLKSVAETKEPKLTRNQNQRRLTDSADANVLQYLQSATVGRRDEFLKMNLRQLNANELLAAYNQAKTRTFYVTPETLLAIENELQSLSTLVVSHNNRYGTLTQDLKQLQKALSEQNTKLTNEVTEKKRLLGEIASHDKRKRALLLQKTSYELQAKGKDSPAIDATLFESPEVIAKGFNTKFYKNKFHLESLFALDRSTADQALKEFTDSLEESLSKVDSEGFIQVLKNLSVNVKSDGNILILKPGIIEDYYYRWYSLQDLEIILETFQKMSRGHVFTKPQMDAIRNEMFELFSQNTFGNEYRFKSIKDWKIRSSSDISLKDKSLAKEFKNVASKIDKSAPTPPISKPLQDALEEYLSKHRGKLREPDFKAYKDELINRFSDQNTWGSGIVSALSPEDLQKQLTHVQEELKQIEAKTSPANAKLKELEKTEAETQDQLNQLKSREKELTTELEKLGPPVPEQLLQLKARAAPDLIQPEPPVPVQNEKPATSSSSSRKIRTEYYYMQPVDPGATGTGEGTRPIEAQSKQKR